MVSRLKQSLGIGGSPFTHTSWLADPRYSLVDVLADIGIARQELEMMDLSDPRMRGAIAKGEARLAKLRALRNELMLNDVEWARLQAMDPASIRARGEEAARQTRTWSTAKSREGRFWPRSAEHVRAAEERDRRYADEAEAAYRDVATIYNRGAVLRDYGGRRRRASAQLARVTGAA